MAAALVIVVAQATVRLWPALARHTRIGGDAVVVGAASVTAGWAIALVGRTSSRALRLARAEAVTHSRF